VRVNDVIEEDESSNSASGAGSAICGCFHDCIDRDGHGASGMLYLCNVLHREPADLLLGSLHTGSLPLAQEITANRQKDASHWRPFYLDGLKT